MVTFFVKALVALFTIVDPVGLVPVVLALTTGMTPPERTLVIFRATIIAGIVIAVFGVFGQFIFASLGVTSEAFSIAGGALLFLVAFDMLFGRQSGTRETRREAREARTREDVSVFPLAIPMIAGPGTITTIILLVGNAGSDPIQLSLVAIAAILTLASSLATMLISAQIQKRIGTTGILVLSRVLGILLAAVALQFILNGITLYIRHVAR
ncbi:MAG TPA: MarC family protein [Ktedonobacterales bacterium]|nr:MarC family protein [Ktedonobacterales bacterium]